MTARTRALHIVRHIQEKKGLDLLLLDLRRASPVADFFVLCTAQSSLHARAIVDNIQLRMKAEGSPPIHIEGHEPGQWVLVDFVDVIVHVFLDDVRQFYGLERLWGDMPMTRFEDAGAGGDN